MEARRYLLHMFLYFEHVLVNPFVRRDEKHKAEIALTKEAQKIEDLENTHLMQKLLRLEAAAEVNKTD